MNGRIFSIVGVFAVILIAVLVQKRGPVAVKDASAAADNVIQPVPTAKDSVAMTETASPNGGAPDSKTTATPEPPLPIADSQTNDSNDLTALEKRQKLIARAIEWAASDPDGALNWVLQLPKGDDRNEALQAVCLSLAQKDPARAVGLAQTLQQPSAVMENLLQQWASSDLLSALTWANGQPSGEVRDHMIQRVAFVLSQTDPTDAAGLVLKQIPPGPDQDEAVMTVLHQWGQQNIQAAATWALTLPAGPLLERATRELEGIQQYQKL